MHKKLALKTGLIYASKNGLLYVSVLDTQNYVRNGLGFK